MRTRAITGLFFVIVLLSAMFLGQYVFAVFFIVLSICCLDEFYRIIADDAAKPSRPLGLLVGGVLFAAYAALRLDIFTAHYLGLIAPLIASVFITALYKKQEKPFAGIAYTLLGVLYVVLPFASFFTLGIMGGVYDYRLPLGFMLILWSNDTGAYLAGRRLGKHLLFERISPKKTWEGFAGGVLLALVTAMAIAHYFPVIAPWQWITIALIIAIFGTFGDLVESMLKRSQRVKDSGALLPGHGGLLDRFDGLLLAAPIVLAFLHTVLN
ncbi:phosphatidate cytidylyltransferase [Parapedobacter composti]|uniref:Phosphatidate cytidylyltransferase n=1 Tax=Parapedobacter composti TaxID=623281 RepID=A0A1I1FYT8_9SPHI|nr:phosphatidate cytidylyltransferase [Parapedobacter composti]SFC04637.1 phosphatidate cytidylyltransferase [Parapedobacter composti]